MERTNMMTAEELSLALRDCSYDPTQDIRPFSVEEDRKPVSYLETKYRQLWFNQFCKEERRKGVIDDSDITVYENLGIIIVKAKVFIDGELVGASCAGGNIIPRDMAHNRSVVQRTATSAKGRALANAGFGILETEYDDEQVSRLCRSPDAAKPVRSSSNPLVYETPAEKETDAIRMGGPEQTCTAQDKQTAEKAQVKEEKSAAAALPSDCGAVKQADPFACGMPDISDTALDMPTILGDDDAVPGIVSDIPVPDNLVIDDSPSDDFSPMPEAERYPGASPDAGTEAKNETSAAGAGSVCMTREQALNVVFPMSEAKGHTVKEAVEMFPGIIARLRKSDALKHEKYKEIRTALEIVCGEQT